MNRRKTLFTLVSCVLASIVSGTSDLPVIFFHGATMTHKAGDNFVAHLTAEGRTVVSLSFCEGMCSVRSLLTQVSEAVEAVREVVANNSVFDNGYIFVSHSQGSLIARAVIEDMDDHNVRRFVSLAGLQNGQFTGPENAKVSSTSGALMKVLVPQNLFNYSAYAPEEYYGKMQKDLALYTIENPDVQYQYAHFNVNRWPQLGSFSTANFFLPVYNNVNRCLPGDNQRTNDQKRRKANFLRMEEAHFFASPADTIIKPWQNSIYGRYSEIDTIEDIETQFKNLTIVNMTGTLEYTSDTFGLKTLDERGGLFIHEIANITHLCWVEDDGSCVWATAYDQYMYSTLA